MNSVTLDIIKEYLEIRYFIVDNYVYNNYTTSLETYRTVHNATENTMFYHIRLNIENGMYK